MQTTAGGQVAYGTAYVAAENSDEAYRKVRRALDKRDLGFARDREMLRVELLAEAHEYPLCGVIYYD
jgi:hypothetical protein